MFEINLLYTSILDDILSGYVTEKRAVGYKYVKGARLLKQLDDHIIAYKLFEKVLPKDIVLAWIKKRPNETDSTRNGRISIIRNLAIYMNRIGYKAYVVPNNQVNISRYSYNPYIFTEHEISNILTVCDQYPSSSITPNRHRILSLVIRMLYGCGFRISEVLNLRLDDVDLDNGVIHVTGAKYGKERIIPMSNSLILDCRQYSRLVLNNNLKDSYLFPSPYGGHYKASTIYKLFRDVLWKAGIPHYGKGPRLHDLRHTFAVHCLKKWVMNGEDLSNLLPYLSTYLGHNDLRGTQHYLKLTSDLYPTIISCVEHHHKFIIPEVNFYETD